MKQSIKNIALHISIAAFLVSPLSAAPQQPPSEAGAPRISVPVCEATTEYELAEYRYTGRVVPISSVDITSRISADLTKIGFKDGDFVKKGQLLYVFDDTRYDATMKMDQAKIAEYEAKLIYAKNDYERIDQLYKKGVSTKDEMESALSQYKSYQASLLGAKAEFILSEDDYKHCRIYSPISGVIGLTNYTEGNYITPSSGILVTIIQLDPIRVKFSMSTRDFLNNFSDIEGLKKTAPTRRLKPLTLSRFLQNLKIQSRGCCQTIQLRFILETKRGLKKWSYQAPHSCMTKIPPMCLYSTTTTSLNAGTYPSVAWTAGGSS